MSAEKIVNTNENNFPPIETPTFKEEKIKGKVDINDLLARVRDEKKKENKVNLIFLGLFSGLILVVGTILSF